MLLCSMTDAFMHCGTRPSLFNPLETVKGGMLENRTVEGLHLSTLYFIHLPADGAVEATCSEDQSVVSFASLDCALCSYAHVEKR